MTQLALKERLVYDLGKASYGKQSCQEPNQGFHGQMRSTHRKTMCPRMAVTQLHSSKRPSWYLIWSLVIEESAAAHMGLLL